MSDLVKVLKAEIGRIGRKEAKALVSPVRGSTAKLRKSVGNMEERLAALDAEVKRLGTILKTFKQQPTVAPEEAKKVRFTAKGVRSLRARLGLTREEFAQLAKTSSQAIYLWEHKTGALRMRPQALAALISLRELGARDAKRLLVEKTPKAPKAPKVEAKPAKKAPAKKRGRPKGKSAKKK